jgi:hypothetical protein
MRQAPTTAQNAGTAERVAQAALEQAERALQEVRTGEEGTGRVIVRDNPEGVVIAIPREDGSLRRIVLSQDNSQIVALEGVSAAPVSARRKDIPDGVKELMGMGLAAAVAMTVLGPFARGLARRLERRPERVAAGETAQRLAAIEQAVDAVAVEVERISEGQRFTARLLADRATARAEERAMAETERR